MRIARPALAALLLWPVLALGAGAQVPSPETKAARRPPRPVGYPVLPGIWSLSRAQIGHVLERVSCEPPVARPTHNRTAPHCSPDSHSWLICYDHSK